MGPVLLPPAGQRTENLLGRSDDGLPDAQKCLLNRLAVLGPPVGQGSEYSLGRPLEGPPYRQQEVLDGAPCLLDSGSGLVSVDTGLLKESAYHAVVPIHEGDEVLHDEGQHEHDGCDGEYLQVDVAEPFPDQLEAVGDFLEVDDGERGPDGHAQDADDFLGPTYLGGEVI